MKRNEYDLEERTALFAENIIALARKIKIDSINIRIIEQLIGSVGSIGANYMEATGGQSKKDFTQKIFFCKKEARETSHWIRLLAKTNPGFKDELRVLWKENHELILIFSKITNSCKRI